MPKDPSNYFSVDVPLNPIVRAVAKSDYVIRKATHTIGTYWEKLPEDEKRKILIESLALVLERYTIRDLSDIQKALGIHKEERP